MSVIGIDTSNYTTSIAFFDGEGGENCSRLLPVRQGELGLRQSDAVFAHIKSLPELSGRLFSHIRKDAITAVGVSSLPPPVDGWWKGAICPASWWATPTQSCCRTLWEFR